MALTERRIRQIIREELIAEATRLAKDSVDDQIDSILIGFEEQSKVVSEVRRRLREAPEEEPDAEDPPEDAEDEPEEEEEVPTPPPGSDSAVDSSKRDVEDPADPNKPKIDIDQFTTQVARFIQNSNNMLDVKTVIINRAKKFLGETYSDDELLLRFEDLLAHDHDVQPSGVRKDPPQAPAAVGAGGFGA
jgi:hypothetical protein